MKKIGIILLLSTILMVGGCKHIHTLPKDYIYEDLASFKSAMKNIKSINGKNEKHRYFIINPQREDFKLVKISITGFYEPQGLSTKENPILNMPFFSFVYQYKNISIHASSLLNLSDHPYKKELDDHVTYPFLTRQETESGIHPIYLFKKIPLYNKDLMSFFTGEEVIFTMDEKGKENRRIYEESKLVIEKEFNENVVELNFETHNE